ncbi:MAG TPA: Hsp33 family molecular chaperone HslO [Nevskiaceae bacterium]
MRDALTQFLFEGYAVRGAFVDLHRGVTEMLEPRAYAPGVRRIVGEALAATPLLASHLKSAARVSLQYAGDGPLTLLVVQIDDQLQLRGMAKARVGADGEFAELLSGGRFSVLLEPRHGNTRYEGVVPLVGNRLSEALEGYFLQSEQLPTRLCLVAGDARLRGLLLQRMPLPPGASTKVEDSYWEYLVALFATLNGAELLAVEPELLMRRMFHAEPLRVFAPRAIELACHCSRASVSRLLIAMGEAEIRKLLEERGEVEVSCEFCGRVQRYSPLQVHDLFAAQQARALGATQH